MKVRDHAAVIQLQARAVGVEDADDARIHFVIAVVGHGDGFGESFGFVVDASVGRWNLRCPSKFLSADARADRRSILK